VTPEEVTKQISPKFAGWIIPVLLQIVILVNNTPRVFLSPGPGEKQ